MTKISPTKNFVSSFEPEYDRLYFHGGKMPIFCTCPSRSTMHKSDVKYEKITIFGFSFHITNRRPCCRFPIHTVTKEIPRRRITVTSSWKEISTDHMGKRWRWGGRVVTPPAPIPLNSSTRQECTNRLAMATFWRTFYHDGKFRPAWWGWWVHALRLPSRAKLWCTLQLRWQISYSYFCSTLFTSVVLTPKSADLFYIFYIPPTFSHTLKWWLCHPFL